ncbi:MAG: heme lyase CcmF/NrfE family subunit [Wolbachia endosymbiont of Menacanthus eurysternus]|nr:MAG: heme lyase CcmF/NrfE family subunit [Wolbachia endosymbiont of Menacanthus eurysternus]
MCILIYYHITDNFTFKNVYFYSHTTKPLIYKICSVWGNEEGSMLLWTLVLTFYLFLMNIFINNNELKKISLIIQNLICFCFLLFTLFESNPFIRMPKIETDGLGFNPILQDIALIIHPPILYLGYLGSSIPFSLSITKLITGTNEKIWIKTIKSWILISWSLLTLGISLGSWWAYRELGWGGFWFWDPVENISLMPWLLEAILVHLLPIVHNFNVLKNFAIFLILITFILSITGTFLIRSGIIISVHAFADNPKYGLYILILLGIILISSLFIFIVTIKKKCLSLIKIRFLLSLVLKYKKKTNNQNIQQIVKNRKFLPHFTLILINNLLFITAFFIVLIGTSYPLIVKYLTGEIVSVEATYYNTLFNPIALTILVFAIIGQYYWHENSTNNSLLIFYKYKLSFCSAIAILPFILHMNLMIILSIIISTTLLISLLEGFCKKILLSNIKFNKSISLAKKKSKSYYAMILAHAGIAILTLGIAILTGWQEEKENYLKIGDSIIINKFKVTLRNVELIKKKNFHAIRGTMDIKNISKNKILDIVTPEYRFYFVEGQKNTECSIYHNLFYDIYVIIGEIDKSKNKIFVKIYYKPGMPIIWLGSFFIFFGILLAALPISQKNLTKYYFIFTVYLHYFVII